MGLGSTANGSASIAIGNSTIAGGASSFASGLGTQATGSAATSLGNTTTASGDYSLASGLGSLASGSASFAQGNSVTASGDYSTAMGLSATASGSNSFALGNNLTANGASSIAMGSYVSNNAMTGSFIFGDGSNSTPLTNTTNNEFMVRAAGGVRFVTTPGGSTADVSFKNGTMKANGVQIAVNAITSNYNATVDDYTILADASFSNITVTLPAATTKGQLIVITKTDASANSVSVTGGGTDAVVSTSGTSTTTQGGGYTLVADGTSTWYVIANQ